jgi:hypothetical protein
MLPIPPDNVAAIGGLHVSTCTARRELEIRSDMDSMDHLNEIEYEISKWEYSYDHLLDSLKVILFSACSVQLDPSSCKLSLQI